MQNRDGKMRFDGRGGEYIIRKAAKGGSVIRDPGSAAKDPLGSTKVPFKISLKLLLFIVC